MATKKPPPEPKPLHPKDHEFVFQHPMKGCVFKFPHTTWVEGLWCYPEDFQEGGSETRAHDRLQVGDFFVDLHPGDSFKLVHQEFIDALDPLDFTGDSPEGANLLKRIDLASSVMGEGGACTLCGIEPDKDGDVDHRVGCEIVSLMLHVLRQATTEPEDELHRAVRLANEQIARMS